MSPQNYGVKQPQKCGAGRPEVKPPPSFATSDWDHSQTAPSLCVPQSSSRHPRVEGIWGWGWWKEKRVSFPQKSCKIRAGRKCWRLFSDLIGQVNEVRICIIDGVPNYLPAARSFPNMNHRDDVPQAMSEPHLPSLTSQTQPELS